MGLYFPHGLAVINLFTTGWAFVKLKHWHRVGLASRYAGPLPTDLLDFIAPTSGTSRDGNHLQYLRVRHAPVLADAEIDFQGY